MINFHTAAPLRDLLHHIIAHPSKFADDNSLVNALKSQGRTAQLNFQFEDHDGQKEIKGMSLNSLKRYTEELFDGGFEEFNALRIRALTALTKCQETKKNSNKRTKYGLLKRVSELEQELEQHKKINLILLQGIMVASNSLSNLRNVSDSVREKRIEDSQEKLRALVSMNPPPFDILNCFPILKDVKKSNDDFQ